QRRCVRRPGTPGQGLVLVHALGLVGSLRRSHREYFAKGLRHGGAQWDRWADRDTGAFPTWFSHDPAERLRWHAGDAFLPFVVSVDPGTGRTRPEHGARTDRRGFGLAQRAAAAHSVSHDPVAWARREVRRDRQLLFPGRRQQPGG